MELRAYSRMLSVSLDDISVTFEADPGLVGAKRAPYLCLKLGSGKTVSQTTACAKGSRFGVAWEQVCVKMTRA